jgi:hypothetical protein
MLRASSVSRVDVGALTHAIRKTKDNGRRYPVTPSVLDHLLNILRGWRGLLGPASTLDGCFARNMTTHPNLTHQRRSLKCAHSARSRTNCFLNIGG